MSDWIDVAPVAEFTPGQSRLVDVDDVMIGVFNIDGKYYAMEDVCSHDGSSMLGSGVDVGDILENDVLTCPHHGARFCIRTGEALCPPAYEPVNTFPVRVENGMVQIRDDR